MIFNIPTDHIDAPPPPPQRMEISARTSSESGGQVNFRSTATSATPERVQPPTAEVQATESTYRLQRHEERRWTGKYERRFLDLAKKEALETITETELAELESLERMRNALKSKRSFHEILASKRQFEKADKLITALHEYLDTTR